MEERKPSKLGIRLATELEGKGGTGDGTDDGGSEVLPTSITMSIIQ